MRVPRTVASFLVVVGVAGSASAILIDFETASGYGPTDGANLMSPAQPSSGTKWYSNTPSAPAYKWKSTGGVEGSACVLMDSTVATNYHAANFTPSAADWGLASLTPANQQVWFGIRIRLHKNDGNSGRAPATITFQRDSVNPNKGRGLRFSIRQNGDVAIINSPAATLSKVFNDTSAFVHVVGMLDYGAQTGRVVFGETAVHGFTFINEGGTGMDEYGYLNWGSGDYANTYGYDVSFDDVWFGTTPPPLPPPPETVILVR